MNDVILLPVKLQEMRVWAGEQSDAVRVRVLALCDALEDCGRGVLGAQTAVIDAQRLLRDLRADVERLRALIGKEQQP